MLLTSHQSSEKCGACSSFWTTKTYWWTVMEKRRRMWVDLPGQLCTGHDALMKERPLWQETDAALQKPLIYEIIMNVLLNHGFSLLYVPAILAWFIFRWKSSAVSYRVGEMSGERMRGHLQARILRYFLCFFTLIHWLSSFMALLAQVVPSTVSRERSVLNYSTKGLCFNS